MVTADGVNVILDTLAEAFQREHETELLYALEDTFYGPGRKKGERLHDYAFRVQSNVRELAKQGVRLPDQVQGFLLFRRANLSYRPVTGRTREGKPYRVEGRLNIKELISRTRCHICREKGHWARECPNF